MTSDSDKDRFLNLRSTPSHAGQLLILISFALSKRTTRVAECFGSWTREPVTQTSKRGSRYREPVRDSDQTSIVEIRKLLQCDTETQDDRRQLKLLQVDRISPAARQALVDMHCRQLCNIWERRKIIHGAREFGADEDGCIVLFTTARHSKRPITSVAK